jgi:hypothetical protein
MLLLLDGVPGSVKNGYIMIDIGKLMLAALVMTGQKNSNIDTTIG